ncbi:MAG: flagellar FlbD family protein [Acidobacteriaceae bacterium]
MIELTRLNGNRLAVNSDLIEYAESAPDTLLKMVTGEKLLVTESLAEVAERMAAFRARTLADAARLLPGGLPLGAGAALRAMASTSAISHAAERAEQKDADGDALDGESVDVMRRRRRAES